MRLPLFLASVDGLFITLLWSLLFFRLCLSLDGIAFVTVFDTVIFFLSFLKCLTCVAFMRSHDTVPLGVTAYVAELWDLVAKLFGVTFLSALCSFEDWCLQILKVLELRILFEFCVDAVIMFC